MRHTFDPYTRTCLRCDRGVDTLYDCETPRRIYDIAPKTSSKPRRPKLATRKPKRVRPEDAEFTCAYCPEDDAVWPSSAFTYGWSAYHHTSLICNDCYVSRYERIDATCNCGYRARRIWRRKGSQTVYQCRQCRRKELTPAA